MIVSFHPCATHLIHITDMPVDLQHLRKFLLQMSILTDRTQVNKIQYVKLVSLFLMKITGRCQYVSKLFIRVLNNQSKSIPCNARTYLIQHKNEQIVLRIKTKCKAENKFPSATADTVKYVKEFGTGQANLFGFFVIKIKRPNDKMQYSLQAELQVKKTRKLKRIPLEQILKYTVTMRTVRLDYS